MRDAAALAAADLSVWLAQAGEALSDTVLARCVRMQAAPATALDAIGIRRNIVGAIDTTSECVANALDFLLDRPELLAAAAAAREGTLDDVRGFVFEALRFNPQAPFLTRPVPAPMERCRYLYRCSNSTLAWSGPFTRPRCGSAGALHGAPLLRGKLEL